MAATFLKISLKYLPIYFTLYLHKYIYIYIYIFFFFNFSFFSGCCPGMRAEFSCVPFLVHDNTYFSFFFFSKMWVNKQGKCCLFFSEKHFGVYTLAFPDLSDKQEHMLFGFQFLGDKQEEMLPVFLKFFWGIFFCCPSF